MGRAKNRGGGTGEDKITEITKAIVIPALFVIPVRPLAEESRVWIFKVPLLQKTLDPVSPYRGTGQAPARDDTLPTLSANTSSVG